MAEQRNIVSVDLGEETVGVLSKLCKSSGQNQSQVIRDALLWMQLSQGYPLLRKVEKRANEGSLGGSKPKTRRTSAEEHRVIEHYKKVFNYTGRVYYPAVISVIRASGLPSDTLCDIITVAVKDDWVRSMLSREGHVPLHVILSEKVVARLLPKIDTIKAEEETQRQVRLVGTVKPQAIKTLRAALDRERMSAAYDLIQAAQSTDEVNHIVKLALDDQLNNYEQKLTGEDIEE